MKRVYIAGPYSGGDIITILHNIRQGIQKASILMREGYAVFCPFLDFLIALMPGETISKEIYQVNSMEWVECCDVMYVLPGWENSEGTKREIAKAKGLGMPIIYEKPNTIQDVV
jgi:hypothetical protein